MSTPDYETWLLDEGDEIIRRKAVAGLAQLSEWDRAMYCLWVADYSMRNAGDLQAAHDLLADFKQAGLQAARALGLSSTAALFALDDAAFMERYLVSFDAVCRELAAAKLKG